MLKFDEFPQNEFKRIFYRIYVCIQNLFTRDSYTGFQFIYSNNLS